MMKHVPVLLSSVLDMLGDIKNRTVVDCTFGAGGYTRAFLERGAKVIAFDRDTNVVSDAMAIKKEFGDRFNFINSSFDKISELSPNDFDDIVFDLGISSMQIDNGERGFSFRFDGPLDMRMDSRNKLDAATLIREKSRDDLADILYEYGDVKKSYMVADILKKALPTTTFQLRDLIKNPKDIAPIFQALRIAVNDEMGQIKRALGFVHSSLRPGGRCLFVTFHSLEDRLIKDTFRNWTAVSGDVRLPTIESPRYELLRAVKPDENETKNNPRARSAHLRGIKKL